MVDGQPRLLVFSDSIPAPSPSPLVLHDVTEVPPLSVLLFGGAVALPTQEAVALTVAGWLTFHLSQTDLTLLWDTRLLLDWFLGTLCRTPTAFKTHWATSPHLSLLVSTIISLIQSK